MSKLNHKISINDKKFTYKIGLFAIRSLYKELSLSHKPGLVSFIDTGSHKDMDAITFGRGIQQEDRQFAEQQAQTQAERQFNSNASNLLIQASQPANNGQSGFTSDAPASLLRTESGGNYAARNNATGSSGRSGHFGRVQFGRDRFDDAVRAGAVPEGMTIEQFGSDTPEARQAQQDAENWHFSDIQNRISTSGADQYIGQNIGGVTITRDGLVAMAHLGGVGGMNRFLESGGEYNPSDANGTSLSDYASTHAGNTTARQTQQPANNLLSQFSNLNADGRIPVDNVVNSFDQAQARQAGQFIRNSTLDNIQDLDSSPEQVFANALQQSGGNVEVASQVQQNYLAALSGVLSEGDSSTQQRNISRGANNLIEDINGEYRDPVGQDIEAGVGIFAEANTPQDRVRILIENSDLNRIENIPDAAKNALASTISSVATAENLSQDEVAYAFSQAMRTDPNLISNLQLSTRGLRTRLDSYFTADEFGEVLKQMYDPTIVQARSNRNRDRQARVDDVNDMRARVSGLLRLQERGSLFGSGLSPEQQEELESLQERLTN